jgi:hypothetical protein
VNLDGHAAAFEEIVPVLAPDPLIQIIQPAQVTVRVQMRPAAAQPAAPRLLPSKPKPPKPKEKRKP